MLCSTCKLRSSCTRLCDEVEMYLKQSRGKTTYRNKEVSLTDIHIEEASKIKPDDQFNGRFNPYDYWDEILIIVEDYFTPKQVVIFWKFLEGLSMFEIGEDQNASKQAINYVIFGHPKNGGGIIQKIKKRLISGKLLDENCIS